MAKIELSWNKNLCSCYDTFELHPLREELQNLVMSGFV